MSVVANGDETYQSDLSGFIPKIPNVSTQQIYRLEAYNVAEALRKYLFTRGGLRKAQFTQSFFLRLHKDMYGNVWQWAGKIRTTNTNLGSPSHRITQDLIVLEKDMAYWGKSLESSVFLHHRAVQIHPFINGNGRWARLLSNIWLKKQGLPVVLWPDDIQTETLVRKQYIEALKKADGFDYEPLQKLHSRYWERD